MEKALTSVRSATRVEDKPLTPTLSPWGRGNILLDARFAGIIS